MVAFFEHQSKSVLATIFMNNDKPNKIWIKAAALFIAGLLIWETAAWAAPAPLSEVIGGQQSVIRDGVQGQSLVGKIQIPSSVGSIQEVFQSSVVGRQSLVHIEDAHGEPDAQKNTQAILEHLKKEYGIQTFFLEGAWSKLEPALLQFSNDAEENPKILSDLTEKGIVGGPENFLYENFEPRTTSQVETSVSFPRRRESSGERLDPRLRGDDKQNVAREAWSVERVQGYGIEDLELYKKNLAEFRAVMGAKAESDVFLNEMKAGLLTKASQVLNPELAGYFRQWSFQEEIQTDYSAHLRVLAEAAQKHLRLDLNDAREQYDWPMLVRFFKLKELEKNKEQGTRKKEAFLKYLNRTDLKQYKQCFDSESLFFVPCSLSKEGGVREFFEMFYEKASPKGFKFKDYPALSKEWGKQILSQELDAPALIKEIQTLENKLIEKLAQTPDEKKLIAKYREYLLLKKLLHLELSKEEWKQFQTADNRLQTEDLSFLRKQESLNKAFEAALNFYQTAEARDAAMFARTLEWIKKEKIEKAAIITGGFHSEGMGALLKQKNISYLRVQPRITQIHGREHYLKLMTPGRAPGVTGTTPGVRLVSNLRFASPTEPNPFEPQAWRAEYRNTPGFAGSMPAVSVGSKRRAEMRPTNWNGWQLQYKTKPNFGIDMHETYLNRHAEQWDWLEVKGLPVILKEAREEAARLGREPEIRVLVAGASTGEELVRSFYRIVQFLKSQGETIAHAPSEPGWRIRIQGLDPKHYPNNRFQSNMRKETPWTVLIRNQEIPGEQELVQSILETLDEFSAILPDSIQLQKQDMRRVDFKNQPAPHIVLANQVTQYIEPTELRQWVQNIDHNWPKAWYLTTTPKIQNLQLTTHQIERIEKGKDGSYSLYAPIQRSEMRNKNSANARRPTTNAQALPIPSSALSVKRSAVLGRSEMRELPGKFFSRWEKSVKQKAILLKNVKLGGPDVLLRIERSDIKKDGKIGNYIHYNADVLIKGKPTGTIGFIRWVAAPNKVIYQVIHGFFPIGGANQAVYRKYFGQAIGSTILNWLVWEAQSENANFGNAGTGNLALILAARKNLKDMRVGGKHQPKTTASKYFRHGLFLNRDNGLTGSVEVVSPDLKRRNNLYLKSHELGKGLFQITEIQHSKGRRGLEHIKEKDIVRIDERGRIFNRAGSLVARVTWLYDHAYTQYIGTPNIQKDPLGEELVLPLYRSEIRDGGQVRNGTRPNDQRPTPDALEGEERLALSVPRSAVLGRSDLLEDGSVSGSTSRAEMRNTGGVISGRAPQGRKTLNTGIRYDETDRFLIGFERDKNGTITKPLIASSPFIGHAALVGLDDVGTAEFFEDVFGARGDSDPFPKKSSGAEKRRWLYRVFNRLTQRLKLKPRDWHEKNSHNIAEMRLVPIKWIKSGKRINASDDWNVLPPELIEKFEQGYIPVTVADNPRNREIASHFILMPVMFDLKTRGKSDSITDIQPVYGRSGILLEKDENGFLAPILGHIEGRDFLMRVKGAGQAAGGFGKWQDIAGFRRVPGGLDIHEADYEMRSLESRRGLRRFNEGVTVRAVGNLEFETDNSFQAIHLAWTPTDTRMSWVSHDAMQFAQPHKRLAMARDFGKELGELLSLDEPRFPWGGPGTRDNFIAAGGENYTVTDFSTILPLFPESWLDIRDWLTRESDLIAASFGAGGSTEGSSSEAVRADAGTLSIMSGLTEVLVAANKITDAEAQIILKQAPGFSEFSDHRFFRKYLAEQIFRNKLKHGVEPIELMRKVRNVNRLINFKRTMKDPLPFIQALGPYSDAETEIISIAQEKKETHAVKVLKIRRIVTRGLVGKHLQAELNFLESLQKSEDPELQRKANEILAQPKLPKWREVTGEERDKDQLRGLLGGLLIRRRPSFTLSDEQVDQIIKDPEHAIQNLFQNYFGYAKLDRSSVGRQINIARSEMREFNGYAGVAEELIKVVNEKRASGKGPGVVLGLGGPSGVGKGFFAKIISGALTRQGYDVHSLEIDGFLKPDAEEVKRKQRKAARGQVHSTEWDFWNEEEAFDALWLVHDFLNMNSEAPTHPILIEKLRSVQDPDNIHNIEIVIPNAWHRTQKDGSNRYEDKWVLHRDSVVILDGKYIARFEKKFREMKGKRLTDALLVLDDDGDAIRDKYEHRVREKYARQLRESPDLLEEKLSIFDNALVSSYKQYEAETRDVWDYQINVRGLYRPEVSKEHPQPVVFQEQDVIDPARLDEAVSADIRLFSDFVLGRYPEHYQRVKESINKKRFFASVGHEKLPTATQVMNEIVAELFMATHGASASLSAFQTIFRFGAGSSMINFPELKAAISVYLEGRVLPVRELERILNKKDADQHGKIDKHLAYQLLIAPKIMQYLMYLTKRSETLQTFAFYRDSIFRAWGSLEQAALASLRAVGFEMSGDSVGLAFKEKLIQNAMNIVLGNYSSIQYHDGESSVRSEMRIQSNVEPGLGGEPWPAYLMTKAEHDEVKRQLVAQGFRLETLAAGIRKLLSILGREERFVIGRGMGYADPRTHWGQGKLRQESFGGNWHEANDWLYLEDPKKNRRNIPVSTPVPAVFENGTLNWTFQDNMRQTAAFLHPHEVELGGKIYVLMTFYMHLKLDKKMKVGELFNAGRIVGRIVESRNPKSPVAAHVHLGVGLIEKSILERFPQGAHNGDFFKALQPFEKNGDIRWFDSLAFLSAADRQDLFVEGDAAETGFKHLVVFHPKLTDAKKALIFLGRRFPGIDVHRFLEADKLAYWLREGSKGPVALFSATALNIIGDHVYPFKTNLGAKGKIKPLIAKAEIRRVRDIGRDLRLSRSEMRDQPLNPYLTASFQLLETGDSNMGLSDRETKRFKNPRNIFVKTHNFQLGEEQKSFVVSRVRHFHPQDEKGEDLPVRGGLRVLMPNMLGKVFYEKLNEIKFTGQDDYDLYLRNQFLERWIQEYAHAMAIQMTLKNLLWGLPRGGAKGVIFLGEWKKVDGEWQLVPTIDKKDDLNSIARIFRDVSKIFLLNHVIHEGIDGAAPDVNPFTGTVETDRIMEWMVDATIRALAQSNKVEILDVETGEVNKGASSELKRQLDKIAELDITRTPYLETAISFLKNKTGLAWPVLGRYTGKSVLSAGSQYRTESTGEAAVVVAQEMLRHELKVAPDRNPLAGKTAAAQGFGAVGIYSVLRLIQEGAHVMLLSDHGGAIRSKNEPGFTLDEIKKMVDLVRRKQSIIQFVHNHPESADILQKEAADADLVKLRDLGNAELLQADVDLLFLAALNGQIKPDNANLIRAKNIIDIANGGVTPDAAGILAQRDILVAPSILASGGGTAISHQEFLQNASNAYLEKDAVRLRMEKDIRQFMIKIYQVIDQARLNGRTIDLNIASYIVARQKTLAPQINEGRSEMRFQKNEAIKASAAFLAAKLNLLELKYPSALKYWHATKAGPQASLILVNRYLEAIGTWADGRSNAAVDTALHSIEVSLRHTWFTASFYSDFQYKRALGFENQQRGFLGILWRWFQYARSSLRILFLSPSKVMPLWQLGKIEKELRVKIFPEFFNLIHLWAKTQNVDTAGRLYVGLAYSELLNAKYLLVEAREDDPWMADREMEGEASLIARLASEPGSEAAQLLREQYALPMLVAEIKSFLDQDPAVGVEPTVILDWQKRITEVIKRVSHSRMSSWGKVRLLDDETGCLPLALKYFKNVSNVRSETRHGGQARESLLNHPWHREEGKSYSVQRTTKSDLRSTMSHPEGRSEMREGVEILKGGKPGVDSDESIEGLALTNKKGRILKRGKAKKDIAHRDGLYHMSSHIYLVDSKGRLLFQKRSQNKASSKGKLQVSVSGHVDFGELPIAAAAREAEEEIGIQINSDNLIPLTKQNQIYREYDLEDGINREFTTAYLYFVSDSELKEIRENYNTNEVDEFHLIPVDFFETDSWQHPKEYSNTLRYLASPNGAFLLQKIKRYIKNHARSEMRNGDRALVSALSPTVSRPLLNANSTRSEMRQSAPAGDQGDFDSRRRELFANPQVIEMIHGVQMTPRPKDKKFLELAKKIMQQFPDLTKDKQTFTWVAYIKKYLWVTMPLESSLLHPSSVNIIFEWREFFGLSNDPQKLAAENPSLLQAAQVNGWRIRDGKLEWWSNLKEDFDSALTPFEDKTWEVDFNNGKLSLPQELWELPFFKEVANQNWAFMVYFPWGENSNHTATLVPAQVFMDLMSQASALPPKERADFSAIAEQFYFERMTEAGFFTFDTRRGVPRSYVPDEFDRFGINVNQNQKVTLAVRRMPRGGFKLEVWNTPRHSAVEHKPVDVFPKEENQQPIPRRQLFESPIFVGRYITSVRSEMRELLAQSWPWIAVYGVVVIGVVVALVRRIMTTADSNRRSFMKTVLTGGVGMVSPTAPKPEVTPELQVAREAAGILRHFYGQVLGDDDSWAEHNRMDSVMSDMLAQRTKAMELQAQDPKLWALVETAEAAVARKISDRLDQEWHSDSNDLDYGLRYLRGLLTEKDFGEWIKIRTAMGQMQETFDGYPLLRGEWVDYAREWSAAHRASADLKLEDFLWNKAQHEGDFKRLERFRQSYEEWGYGKAVNWSEIESQYQVDFKERVRQALGGKVFNRRDGGSFSMRSRVHVAAWEWQKKEIEQRWPTVMRQLGNELPKDLNGIQTPYPDPSYRVDDWLEHHFQASVKKAKHNRLGRFVREELIRRRELGLPVTDEDITDEEYVASGQGRADKQADLDPEQYLDNPSEYVKKVMGQNKKYTLPGAIEARQQSAKTDKKQIRLRALIQQLENNARLGPIDFIFQTDWAGIPVQAGWHFSENIPAQTVVGTRQALSGRHLLMAYRPMSRGRLNPMTIYRFKIPQGASFDAIEQTFKEGTWFAEKPKSALERAESEANDSTEWSVGLASWKGTREVVVDVKAEKPKSVIYLGDPKIAGLLMDKSRSEARKQKTGVINSRVKAIVEKATALKSGSTELHWLMTRQKTRHLTQAIQILEKDFNVNRRGITEIFKFVLKRKERRIAQFIESNGRLDEERKTPGNERIKIPHSLALDYARSMSAETRALLPEYSSWQEYEYVLERARKAAEKKVGWITPGEKEAVRRMVPEASRRKTVYYSAGMDILTPIFVLGDLTSEIAYVDQNGFDFLFYPGEGFLRRFLNSENIQLLEFDDINRRVVINFQGHQIALKFYRADNSDYPFAYGDAGLIYGLGLAGNWPLLSVHLRSNPAGIATFFINQADIIKSSPQWKKISEHVDFYRSENRLILDEARIETAKEAAEGICSVQFVAGFLSRSEFREFFGSVFSDVILQRQQERTNRALKKLNSAAQITDGLVLGEKLALDKGFLEAVKYIYAGQFVAVLAENENQRIKIQAQIDSLALKNVKAFLSVIEAAQFARGNKSSALRGWLSRDDDMRIAAELKKLVPDIEWLMDSQIKTFYLDLGLTGLVQRIFTSRIISSAA